MAPPLVTLLSAEPEIQYVALRNINLIVQKRPTILAHEIKVLDIFCLTWSHAKSPISNLEVVSLNLEINLQLTTMVVFLGLFLQVQ